eukprot:13528582-Ditylum_brightwellii.AAC.1
MILGWLFDFRHLVVSLPEKKFTAWTDAITEILRRMEFTAKELEQNIRRLTKRPTDKGGKQKEDKDK